MSINLWAVLVCAILSMVSGAIWYGPLFGKKWMELMKVNPSDVERKKQMRKEAGPLYVIQFLLSLFQIYVLAHYFQGWKEASTLENALWIWGGFVVPTLAGACMWTSEPRKAAWTRFLIQTGYQLVNFVIFALVLGAWR